MASRTLAELAGLIQGHLEGEPGFAVTGLSTPEKAQPSELIFLLEPAWLPAVRASAARSVLVPVSFVQALPGKHLLRAPQIRPALAILLQLFAPPPAQPAGIHPTALIHPSARLGEGVSLGPYVTVGADTIVGAQTRLYPYVYVGERSCLGEGCLVYPHVTIREDVCIGHRVIIHSGSVLGSDGYGFYPDGPRHIKIPQIGGVSVGDDVEIGAQVTIDRGTVGDTTIGRGTKIDNQVHIGHNVSIGEDCLLVAQVGISGSTVIGDRVTLAGQVGVAGHLKIGDDAVVAGKSGVTRDIPAGLKVSGFPAQEHRQELRLQAALRRVPEWLREWKRIR